MGARLLRTTIRYGALARNNLSVQMCWLLNNDRSAVIKGLIKSTNTNLRELRL